MTKRTRCNAPTKAGGRCPWFAPCAVHDPAQRDVQRERGKRGGKKSAAARKRVKRASVPLDTVADLRAWLSKLAADVEVAGDPIARASVAVKICSTAIALLEADVADEIEQLKQTLVRLHPHLAAELGVAVPDGDEDGLQ